MYFYDIVLMSFCDTLDLIKDENEEYANRLRKQAGSMSKEALIEKYIELTMELNRSNNDNKSLLESQKYLAGKLQSIK
jgi:hypothetical protein